MSDMFLSQDEIVILTGRPQKSKQIEQLRRMGVPFYVNALGRPIVARAIIEGRRETVPKPEKKSGSPRIDELVHFRYAQARPVEDSLLGQAKIQLNHSY